MPYPCNLGEYSPRGKDHIHILSDIHTEIGAYKAHKRQPKPQVHISLEKSVAGALIRHGLDHTTNHPKLYRNFSYQLLVHSLEAKDTLIEDVHGRLLYLVDHRHNDNASELPNLNNYLEGVFEIKDIKPIDYNFQVYYIDLDFHMRRAAIAPMWYSIFFQYGEIGEMPDGSLDLLRHTHAVDDGTGAMRELRFGQVRPFKFYGMPIPILGYWDGSSCVEF